MTGDGFCIQCGQYVFVNLTGYNEPADSGGTLWQVSPGSFCECGEALNWLRQPPQSYFDLSELDVYSEVERNGR